MHQLIDDPKRSTSPTSLLTRPEAVVFRELTSESDIRAYFQVRYQVYTGNSFIPENVDRLDIDVYDRHSCFVGAFVEVDGQETLVGGGRMILGEGERPNGVVVDRISGRTITEKLYRLPPRWTTYYAENTFNLVDEKRRCAEAGLTLVEFGRTVCLKECRGLGIGKGLILGLYALAHLRRVNAGIAVSPPELKPLYEAFDCRYLDLGSRRFSGLNTELMAMTVDLEADSKVIRESRRWAQDMVIRGRVEIPADAVLVGKV